MKEKSLQFLLMLGLLPAGVLLAGCFDREKCAVGTPPKYFDVQDVSLSVVNSNGQPPVPGQTLSIADFQLELRPQVRYYGFSPAPNSWLPAAYACPPTPLPGYQGTTELIDSLVVRSVYAYDATHPAGSVINDLLLQESTGATLPLAPAPNTKPYNEGERLRLQRAPAQPGSQQFVLRYRLTNGETYTARTPVISLR